MKFWVYMATVFLSLPKSMVFVALGSPSSEGSKAAKWGKVVAIGIVVIISGKSPFVAMPSIIVCDILLMSVRLCSIRQLVDPQEADCCYEGDQSGAGSNRR